MKTDILILCGGKGSRFIPVSKDLPKALALVSKKPVLDWILNLLGFKIIKSRYK